MTKRLDINTVRSLFETEGYKLLTSEYKNAGQRLPYICPEGHKHSITYRDWYNGYRCPHCNGGIRLNYELIKASFEADSYILLDSEYKNWRTPLNYICPNGHKHKISWNNWKRGVRCPYCAGQGKPTIESIRSELSKENYELLTDRYINNTTKLKYICPEGHEHKMSWQKWQQGQRCPKCYRNNCFGSNTPNWAGGISIEPYCEAWKDEEYKESIRERDGYKCLNPECNFITTNLNIHHIDYNKKNCKPKNLITLCRSCNAKANFDRSWHKKWYKAILHRRYRYVY